MTNPQQVEDEPLLVEITPEIASDLLVILKHMPRAETEPTLEEVVAMAVAYFRGRLERGETEFVEDEDEAQSK
jgi:hypothetical protein